MIRYRYHVCYWHGNNRERGPGYGRLTHECSRRLEDDEEITLLEREIERRTGTPITILSFQLIWMIPGDDQVA